ncbi:hypothetical protein HOK68_00825 [Candidatus Woesearchaeota archaeon]|nr:hypothetical protein [Candidatus Woesearchaeota archaeon]MBT4387292.1 hypothetical protein [Candidatus Woesearchaeota archaeon]MBT4595431.1 hypothetical protein [Candidatus Woesearchaeota archaeon]MBT5741146.1 hypothetical protein [Candidatus Woesearchaeota archaeon]MBT6505304.1 hypothetical protein [Candidatus Woesearchaeota archaeon]
MIDKYIEKICAEKNISKEEVEKKIEKKIEDLDGLISKEGAIFIIANSLGVELNRSALITDKIIPGMKNININLRILNMYDTIEFNKEENKGRVKSLWCANNNIKTRVVLWNEVIDSIEDIKEGDIISIQNAYAKENRNNSVEIHCSNYSTITKTEDESIPPFEELKNKSSNYKQVNISQIKEENQKVQIKANIVNIFPIKFFEICPECNKRAKLVQDKFQCEVHGEVKPKIAYVITTILDDGTETIRATFFREQVCKLIGKTDEEIVNLKEDIDAITYELETIKGDLVEVKANSKLNSFTNQIEVNVNNINKNIDIDNEIKNLKEKIITYN